MPAQYAKQSRRSRLYFIKMTLINIYQRMITARFVEDPSAPFQIATDSPDRNYFNLGLNMAATWPARAIGLHQL